MRLVVVKTIKDDPVFDFPDGTLVRLWEWGSMKMYVTMSLPPETQISTVAWRLEVIKIPDILTEAERGVYRVLHPTIEWDKI